MHSPKYALFFDNHTMALCPDVGADFNAEEFAACIGDCGVDFIGFHAKCNQGFCYYDTKIGIKHPSLTRDMFGELIAACRTKNIAVSAYLNCGLSNEEALRHPDWNTVSPNGEILHPGIYDIGWVSPYIRTMCVNSPYRDYLISLILEVADKYPVAGFLLDSFNGFPCICPVCIRDMKKRGINWRDADEVQKFARFSVLRLAEDISAAVRNVSCEYLLYFLGVTAVDNIRVGSYLECECLPTYPCWGYDYLPIMSHHLRTLSNDGRPILNMTGRFYEWGDFGSIRPQAALEFDLFYGIANGMRPNIGGHIHPRGSTQRAIFDRIRDVYSQMQRNEEWYDGAKNLADIGVLITGAADKTPPLIGVTRMLSELKMQFDIINTAADFSKYHVLILPDDVILTPETAGKIEKFLAGGKAVIASGCSGLDPEKEKFVLEDEWGVTYAKECRYDPAYFQPLPQLSSGLPDIPLATYRRGLEVIASNGTEVAAVFVKPYFNREWDGVYANFYVPPDSVTDQPFVTFKRNLAYISSPLFSAYHDLASVDLRKLFSYIIARLQPAPLLKVAG
ncbi:beta-galactosidase trimerization domain-containing protein, partial [Patescibacteria group bacterium]|nr:beta-galactosidase trimerization domain-containing protein [Patescibacteria group bacterium]